MAPNETAVLIEAVEGAIAALGLGTAIGLGLAGIALAVELLVRGPRRKRRTHRPSRPKRRQAREAHS